MDKSFGKVALFYLLTVLLCGTGYFFINQHGETILPTDFTSNLVTQSTSHTNNVLHILLALVVVIVVARLVGLLFAFINQPMVIGEVVGGIILGPSLLGRYAPEVMEYILPASIAPFLSIVSQLGLILYMFLIGLELDLKVIRRSGRVFLGKSLRPLEC